MDIYIADLTKIISNTPLINSYINRLTKEDVDRFNRMTHECRKLQFLVARMMIYEHLGRNLIVSDSGKLLYDGAFLSVSHSEDMVVLVTSSVGVGIDVEDTRKKRDFKGLARRCGLGDISDQIDFYEKYTKYEAEYKLDTSSADCKFYCWNHFLICVTAAERINSLSFWETIPFVEQKISQNVQSLDKKNKSTI